MSATLRIGMNGNGIRPTARETLERVLGTLHGPGEYYIYIGPDGDVAIHDPDGNKVNFDLEKHGLTVFHAPGYNDLMTTEDARDTYRAFAQLTPMRH